MTLDEEMNYKEHQIMLLLNSNPNQQYFPKTFGGGSFKDDNGQTVSFIIMEKLGNNLENYLYNREQNFSMQTECQIGIQLISCIEMLHQTGYVHNDIKLDNIIVGDGSGSEESQNQIRLIDFGLCSSYVDEEGNHI